MTELSLTALQAVGAILARHHTQHRLEDGREVARTVGRMSPPGTFFDMTAFHVMSRRSLATLADAAPTSRIAMARFRPNRRYRKEMARPETRHLPELLAQLSQQTHLAVGCYCADEARCHRSLLRALLLEHGAQVE